MLSNQDIDELLVMAEMDMDDAIEESLEDYYRPDIERETAIFWTKLEEPIKKLVKMRPPEAVRRIEELLRK